MLITEYPYKTKAAAEEACREAELIDQGRRYGITDFMGQPRVYCYRLPGVRPPRPIVDVGSDGSIRR